MGETTGALHRTTLARAGLPVFATPDQAVQRLSGTWCETGATARRRANCPPARCWRIEPERDWVRRRFDRGTCRRAGCALRRMKRWRCWAPTVFRPCRPVLPPVRSMRPRPRTCWAIRRWSSCATRAAPADRLPGSLVFDLHDAPQVVAAAPAAVGPGAAARRDGRTAGAAPCRARARGRDPGCGRRHVRPDDHVWCRRHDAQPGRPGGRSAAVEPGSGAWPDPAQPHRRDAGQAAARPARRPMPMRWRRCWCGSAS